MSFRTSERLENAATAELLRAAERLEAVNERNFRLQEQISSLESELAESQLQTDKITQLKLENDALHVELETAYRLVAELKKVKKVRTKAAAAAASGSTNSGGRE
jgi:ATP-dependent Lon protease